MAVSSDLEKESPVFTVSAPIHSPQVEKIPDENNTYLTAPSTPGGCSLSSVDSLVTLISVCSDQDPVNDTSSNDTVDKTEKWWSTTLQVALPFFLAGIGTIGAGLVLGNVQNWPVFQEVSSLFILVPSLLGLKGNLDMCLASRLSTQANCGNMRNAKEIWCMIIGNIALVQVQAIVAALLVSLFAVSVGAVIAGSFNMEHALLLSAASITTATTSCFILDFVMIAVILLSHKFKMNPDNVATPLAASIGDVVSITLLSTISSFFYTYHESMWGAILGIIGGYIAILPFWVWLVLRNIYTRQILKSGWVPVLSALLISGFGGLVLDAVVNIYTGFVVFQPIINGIGGNLVSVQASRISTLLHQTSPPGVIPAFTSICASPWKALFHGLPHAKTARILIAMSVPGHLVFIFVADYIHNSKTTINLAFALTYITVALCQVMFLLYTAHLLIHFMWKKKIDPDNSAIPFLTALGDLTGSGFLAMAFMFLHSIKQEYVD